MTGFEENTYIVTGATGAIGRAIVSELVKLRAAHIILACRDAAKALNAISLNNTTTTVMEFLPLNLADFSSVKEFANTIIRRGIKINGLVHNAGTMPGKVNITKDGYEIATQTNFLSTGLLTELLIDSMAKDSKIVFTTSMTRRIARLRSDWQELSTAHHQRFVTYGRSKLMLTHYAVSLAQRLSSSGICVNCSDPWIVDSSIILMDNRIIDSLSARFAKYLFHSPFQGAAPTIDALRTSLSGYIFSLKGHKRIPDSYLRHPLHKLPSEIIGNQLAQI